MTRILSIIALLFATPAWAGEVDGNSFYCEGKSIKFNKDNKSWKHLPDHLRKKKLETPVGQVIELDGGMATTFYLSSSSSEFTKQSSQYTAYPSSVVWSDRELNRKTLTLTLGDLMVGIFQCEILELDEAFKKLREAFAIRERINKMNDIKAREGNQF